MIDVNEAIRNGNPLVISKAIEQRKKLRDQKLDLIEHLRTHDYSGSIAFTRAEIIKLQERLQREERQQASLPDTIETLWSDREKLTKQIAKLRTMVPKDAAGKLAKRLERLDLPASTIEAFLELLKHAEN